MRCPFGGATLLFVSFDWLDAIWPVTVDSVSPDGMLSWPSEGLQSVFSEVLRSVPSALLRSTPSCTATSWFLETLGFVLFDISGSMRLRSDMNDGDFVGGRVNQCSCSDDRGRVEENSSTRCYLKVTAVPQQKSIAGLLEK